MHQHISPSPHLSRFLLQQCISQPRAGPRQTPRLRSAAPGAARFPSRSVTARRSAANEVDGFGPRCSADTRGEWPPRRGAITSFCPASTARRAAEASQGCRCSRTARAPHRPSRRIPVWRAMPLAGHRSPISPKVSDWHEAAKDPIGYRPALGSPGPSRGDHRWRLGRRG